MNAKPLWLGAVLVVLAGYGFLFRGAEARIDDRLDANARTLAQLAADERTLRAGAALARERRALGERLRRVDLDGDRTAVVARFIRAAARIAAQHHTAVSTIAAQPSAAQPSAAQPSPAASPAPLLAAADPFEPIPLDLTVDGRYADVLATIAALSGARVLVAVEVVGLARKQAGSADPALRAQLHVVIERLALPAASAPAPDVRARPA